MPKSQVEVRRSYTAAEEVTIMDAVQNALVVAFKIPETDRTVRYIEHDPRRFSCSPTLDQPDRYTLVTIDCFSGRSVDAKRELYRQIVDRLSAVGIPHDHVTVILHEVARENWGIDGGQVASEIDLGFEVSV